MNIAASLEHYSEFQPNAPAIVFESKVISYRALHEHANRFANFLQAMAIGKGDRVALLLPNVPAFAYCYFGSLKIGAIVVSISPGSTPSEVETVLRDSGASVLIVAEGTADCKHLSSAGLPHLKHVLTIEDLLDNFVSHASSVAETADLAANHPAAILYTSGTTGIPKGATLSHGNVVFTMTAKRRSLRLTANDRMLLFLPLHHCFGQNAILNGALGAGAAVVLHRSFDAGAILRSVADDEVTVLCGVPTTFRLLYEKASPDQMASVRLFFSAAAPLPRALEAQWREKFGSEIYQGYGLTETSPFASYNHLTRHKRGSIGVPIAGVEMRVADVDTGAPVATGAIGEIAVRGPNVMLGYWDRPQDTAHAIREGWFHTGDVGRMDSDGYFYVEDRLKDMIIVGGSNVYSAEVENVLLRHVAVLEAAVYGIADAVLGERVKAAIVLKGGNTATGEDLIHFCAGQLSRTKIPVEVQFVNELPRNRAGKVLKRVLRERSRQVNKNPAIVPSSITRPELERRLVDWLTGHLHLEKRSVDLQAPFAEYGLNSILAVTLAGEISRWIGRPVTPTITWHFSTISTLAARLIPEPELPNRVPHRPEVAELSEEEAECQLLGILEQFVS